MSSNISLPAYLDPARPHGLEEIPTLVEPFVRTRYLPRLKGDAERETHHRYHQLQTVDTIYVSPTEQTGVEEGRGREGGAGGGGRREREIRMFSERQRLPG